MTFALVLICSTTASAAHADVVEVAREAAPATVAQAPVQAFTAAASIPNGVVVRGHQGQIVSLTTSGQEAINKSARSGSPVVFTGLTAGRPYAVWVNGQAPLPVTPVAQVKKASGLVVTATTDPGTVDLSWKHQRTTATGGRAITYLVAATSKTAPTVRTTVTGVTHARLSRLDPSALYRFSVTPRNSATTGGATTAVMARTLADLTRVAKPAGPASDTAASPSPAPPATGTPVAVTSPTTTDAPASSGSSSSAPRTRTIWVCPDGYADTGSTCERTSAYTFHTVTETQAYTFTNMKVGTESYTDTCSSGYTDANGNFNWIEQPHPCTRTRDVYADVKDAAPAGFADDGTQWVKASQVKDDTPSGYTDSGSAWVTTTSKVSREVTA